MNDGPSGELDFAIRDEPTSLPISRAKDVPRGI
jgi:hypothetical protein